MTRSLPFHIRVAEQADVAELCRLLDILFSIEADFTPDAVLQRQGLELLLQRGNTAVVLVAEWDGEVIGMCSAQTLVSTAQGSVVALVEDVVVEPGRRGEGVGGALLDALEGWARENGITRLQLLADRANTPALDFYQGRGWQATQLMAWRKFIE